jgi:PAS domain S-box-containing protein
VICTYPLAKSGAAEVLDVVESHQFATARRQGEWKVIETPELIQAKAEIKRLNETLQHATERTPKPSVILSYGVAVLSVSAALIIALWMESVLQSAAHVSLFLCAVMLSTWIGGIRPGLLAIALSVLAFAYILSPNYSLAVETREIPRLLIFGLSALLVGSVSAALRSKAESLTHARDILNETVQELKRTNVALQAENAERKRAEDALRRSEDRLRLVIDTVPALIHTGLPDGQLDFFNQRWLDFVGLSLEDLSGWKWTTAIHPEDVAAMVERWRAALATGEPYEHEARVRRADGEYRWMVHREVPLRDGRGNIVKWYASSIDIEDRKRAEDALRRSEDHLRLVIDTIPVMAWSLRTDGVVDFLNQRWMDYSGVSLEQYVEEPTRPVHPADIPRVMEKWLADMVAGEPNEDEMRLRRADGEYRWFLVRNAPLRDEQGNVVKWYGASIDIQERKQVEEALRQAEEKYHSIFEHAIEGIFQTTPDGHYITANPALARMLGYDSPEELLKHRTDIARQQYVETERRAEFKRLLEEQGVVRRFEYQAYRKDGHKIWLSDNVRAVRDESGAVLYYEGSTEDITERKQVEEQLRRAEEQARQVRATISQQIWSGPTDGTLDYCNYQWRAYTGLRLEELDGHGWQQMLHPDDQERVLTAWRESVATGKPYEQEERHRRFDGVYRWFLCRGLPLRNAEGRIERWYGTNTDIEDRKRAEERLRATTEQLRALSARLQSAREDEATRIAREIHDELGAALTSLRWELESLDKTLSDSESGSQLHVMRERIKDMMRLVDTTVSTIRRITQELRPSVLDDLGLAEAIEWQAQQFQTRTGIICHCDCSLEDVALSQEQSTAVFRIFQETLTNILRHAQATRVDITMEEEDGEFVLTINDNGRGITEDQKSGQRSLGLLGMRERAHLIGGKIDITGVEGKGTVVTLRILISG